MIWTNTDQIWTGKLHNQTVAHIFKQDKSFTPALSVQGQSHFLPSQTSLAKAKSQAEQALLHFFLCGFRAHHIAQTALNNTLPNFNHVHALKQIMNPTP